MSASDIKNQLELQILFHFSSAVFSGIVYSFVRLIDYRTQIRNKPFRTHFYFPGIVRYDGHLRPFSRRSRKVFAPEKPQRSLKPNDYRAVLYINRGSLLTRSFRRIHLFVFGYRLTENGFAGPKSFPGFRETGLLVEFGQGKCIIALFGDISSSSHLVSIGNLDRP